MTPETFAATMRNPEIPEDDKKRIAFAQQLLDRGAGRGVAFNEPALIKVLLRRGLLKPTANLEAMFETYGKLLANATLKPKRLAVGMVAAIEQLTDFEALMVAEQITGVVQMPKRMK